jgi:hypothetical protein
LFFKLCYICANSVPDPVHDLDPRSQTFGIVVRVAHDHRGRLPSAQFLNRIEIHAALHQPRRERMAQVVKAPARGEGQRWRSSVSMPL